MKLSRIFRGIVLAFVVCSAVCASAADSGVLSGTVRDADGKPLAGATVSLSSSQTPPVEVHATSDPSGEYRFTGLALGDYSIAAELSGYTASSPAVVHILSASMPVVADLKLVKTSTPAAATDADASAAFASGTSASSQAPPEFQSAGIRGLIDPGGYSASTAGAATGILRGIADVRRTDKSFATAAANSWPCALEPELRKAAADHPDQVEADRSLGQFYVAHDQPAQAIPPLKQALQIVPNDFVASREIAMAWLESGDFEQARKQLTSLVEQHDLPEVHQLLARANEGSGLFQQAAQQYGAADAEEPSEESLFGEGYELILAGSVTDGAAALNTGVQRYPRSIPMRIGLGTAQFLQGKSPAAVQSFLEATDIDPADPRPYSFLAAASGAIGDNSERVRSAFKHYQARNPSDASANYFYALALSRQTPPAEVGRIQELLKRAIQLDPNLARAHLQLADLYVQRDDFDDAIAEYETAVRLAQDLGEAHYRLAMAYKRVGQSDQSAREMQIFLLSKQRQAAGAGGVDLAQFISVMDAPDQHASQETQCSVSSH
jgi:tetratricopeptide (TPR) repeat protein